MVRWCAGRDGKEEQLPIYTYACKACSAEIERRQSFSDAALTVCETCGGVLRRVLHPVGVIFKGSGFYNTDNRKSTDNGATAEGATADTKTGEAKDGAKAGDAKDGAKAGEAKSEAKGGDSPAPASRGTGGGADSTGKASTSSTSD